MSDSFSGSAPSMRETQLRAADDGRDWRGVAPAVALVAGTVLLLVAAVVWPLAVMVGGGR